MRRYGEEHSLSLHGEMTGGATLEPIFNYYLADGYNYFAGDDLDLEFTSDPFREGQVDLNVAPRHKPVTTKQMELALGLLAAIRDLSTKTVVGDITAATPDITC